ncbi:hypothetical protein Tco_0487839 [Tanacetum coccineum]
MKLNPKKCSFGVEEGKFFLGYIGSPSKESVQTPKRQLPYKILTSPKTLNEDMQKPHGKLASLNRFLASQRKDEEADNIPSIINTALSAKETLYAYLQWQTRLSHSTADRIETEKDNAQSICEHKRLNLMPQRIIPSGKAGPFLATKESMIKYLAKAKEFISEFKTFSIENIPREDNQKADILSKLATVPFSHLTKEILVEVLNERSTDAKEVQTIVEEEGEKLDDSHHPLLGQEGIVPSDKNKARSLRAKISQYVIESGVLSKKGYLVPMLRCVGPLQANYIIREIHMGSCGMHIGPRVVVRKAMRDKVYWPTMNANAKRRGKTNVTQCSKFHSPIPSTTPRPT